MTATRMRTRRCVLLGAGVAAGLAGVLAAAGCSAAHPTAASISPSTGTGAIVGTEAGVGSAPTAASTATGTLVVHIGRFGGPVRANGQMALNDAPVAGATVIVIGAGDDRWSARTDAKGNASLVLPTGRYSTHST